MAIMATVRPDTARPARPGPAATRVAPGWLAPVWLVLGADLRRTWRSMLGLALLLGLIGGVVLTAAAGARRTDTAYPRLLAWANASQVDVLASFSTREVPEDYYAALGRLPQVAAMATAVLYQVALPGNPTASTSQVNATGSPDGALGVSVDKVKVLAGRMFAPGTPDRAVIDPQLAALEHVGPGGTLRLLGVPNAPGTAHPEPAKAVPVSFLVTAVVTFDNQIVPLGGSDSGGAAAPTALLSSFPVAGAAQTMSYGNEAAVRLRPGGSLAAFTAAANALAARYKDTAGQVFTISQADQVVATQRAIRPQAVALGVFAGLAGLTALAVLGQLLARQLTLDAAEFPVLRALGMPRGALTALSLARLAVVTVTGGVVSVAVAVAASPLTPLGPARLAEPAPGIDVNFAVLGAGFRGGGARAARGTRRRGSAVGPPGRRAAWRRRAGRFRREPVPAARRTWPGGIGDRRTRHRDGFRAGPRADRGARAQRHSGLGDRACRADRRHRVRRQPDRPGLHAGLVRAELGRPA